jgi:predicted nucleic acid-binding protein
MSYLLDSNVVIKFLADEPSATNLIRVLGPTGLFVSVITVMEVRHGLVKGGETSLARLDAFLANISALDVNVAIANRCADLRASLAVQGKTSRNRTLDLLIASTAIHHDLVLVTHNVHDFQDVPGLFLRR